MRYDVTIKEARYYTITVDADDVDQAEEIAQELYTRSDFDSTVAGRNADIEYENTAVFNYDTGEWERDGS